MDNHNDAVIFVVANILSLNIMIFDDKILVTTKMTASL